MISPQQLGRLCLGLILALPLTAAPVFAQPAQPKRSTPAAGQSAPAADSTAAPQQTPAAGESGKTSTAAGASGTKSTAPDGSNKSPFDYRPSEEISEDVPVSFPVDI